MWPSAMRKRERETFLLTIDNRLPLITALFDISHVYRTRLCIRRLYCFSKFLFRLIFKDFFSIATLLFFVYRSNVFVNYWDSVNVNAIQNKRFFYISLILFGVQREKNDLLESKNRFETESLAFPFFCGWILFIFPNSLWLESTNFVICVVRQ